MDSLEQIMEQLNDISQTMYRMQNCTNKDVEQYQCLISEYNNTKIGLTKSKRIK